MNLPNWLRRILAMAAWGADGSSLQRRGCAAASLHARPREVLSLQGAAQVADKARAAASARDWNRAAELWGRVVAGYPDNTDALVAQADALREGQRLPVAEKAADIGALESAAKEFQTRKEYDRSIPLWTQLNELRPDRWEYAVGLALDLRGSGRNADAEDAYHLGGRASPKQLLDDIQLGIGSPLRSPARCRGAARTQTDRPLAK